MTEIIKKGDSYWYGDIEMVKDHSIDCYGCPLFDGPCERGGTINKQCNSMITRCFTFKLKENKTTMTTKMFKIDNGDKQFKAKLWLEERNVCFQVLEQSDKLFDIGRVDNGKTVKSRNGVELKRDYLYIRGKLDVTRAIIVSKIFSSNADRDEYFTKACGWLQEFCDVNSVVEKFDVYDVKKWEVGYRYKDNTGCTYSVFGQGVDWDNFAGIQYQGGENEWFMDRVVLLGGHLTEKYSSHNDEFIKQAIPEKIRFFKEAK